MALGHPALKFLLVINFQNFVDEEGCVYIAIIFTNSISDDHVIRVLHCGN